MYTVGPNGLSGCERVKEKSALEVSCPPKLEMLPTSLSKNDFALKLLYTAVVLGKDRRGQKYINHLVVYEYWNTLCETFLMINSSTHSTCKLMASESKESNPLNFLGAKVFLPNFLPTCHLF